ncbi:MAG: M1 family metallopeptidase [bacterium]|nr:M1 family metallopeptidase [bacterium]
MGPISLGFRISTADAPGSYVAQVYRKGPLVLHMIRMLMRNYSGDDKLFRSVVKEFILSFKKKSFTTDDFKNIIEKRTGQDWDWFFEQWVHGTELPKYNYHLSLVNRKKRIVVTIEQSNVPEGFKMPIPLRVTFKDGSIKFFNLPVGKKTQTFQIPLEAPAKKVEFNPDFSVAAKMKKKY